MPEALPFRRRPRGHIEQLRELVRSECLDVTWSKGDRGWRFWIRPGKALGEWYCQVWLGAETQHRGEATMDRMRVHRLKGEYFREMAELETDGWTISAGADPRPKNEPPSFG